MKCNDCLLLLEEYFDGELDVKQTQSINSHLFGCSACSKEYKMLEKENSIYKNYERNITMNPELCSLIEDKVIKPQKQVSWWKNFVNNLSLPNFVPVSVAATVILVTVIATVMLMKNFSSVNVNPNPIASITPINTKENIVEYSIKNFENNIESTGVNALENKMGNELTNVLSPKIVISKANKRNKVNDPAQKLIQEATEKYVTAIKILSKDAKKNYQQLPSEVKASFDKSLKAIDENIAQTRRAMGQNPNNPIIAQYMLAAYAKKVEVLQEITAIDKEFSN